ncbi:MAG: hypothetical protein QOE68_1181 [Thermoanaerobaculia bacterium]|jgi:hypothetical protein|nr:hypothetical protein [Thermoanaerobaculia bacterium]
MVRSAGEVTGDSLKACADWYTHLYARFTALDVKAQATATISGVFIAATITFAGGNAYMRMSQRLNFAAPATIVLVAMASLIALLFCLYAMELRPVRLSYTAEDVARSAADLLRLPRAELTDAVATTFYLEQLVKWEETIAAMREAILRKALPVMLGQLFVATAAVIVTLFLFALARYS